jgi:hypothetical protein
MFVCFVIVLFFLGVVLPAHCGRGRGKGVYLGHGTDRCEQYV